MKLATVKNGTRDGMLVVVSKDLTQATAVGHIAPTLQSALDNWGEVAPRLERCAEMLAGNAQPTFRFREHDAMAPLPRAYQWLDGSAYVNHVELVRKARKTTMPDHFFKEPIMYQGGSDVMNGPRDPIRFSSSSFGVDFEGEVAVIVGDVPKGVSEKEAANAIRLLVLVNDITLRELLAPEVAKGFGFVHSKPSSTLSPVAVTPDELGDAWRDGRVHLPMLVSYNEKPFGEPNAGIDMTFNFPRLIAHAARTRDLTAGTIIGSGTVSNKFDGGPGKRIVDGGVGYSCIIEQRMVEIIETGEATTEFMKSGDQVRIEMKNEDGQSVFGAIEQTFMPSEN